MKSNLTRFLKVKNFHNTACQLEREHPFNRTVRVLRNDIKSILTKPKPLFPTHCDVLIIGGGAIGSSIAYNLKQRAGKGLDIVLIEKDPTYKYASTGLSAGGIRQQFSLPENIQMSLYGAEFLRNIKQNLNVDVSYTPNGYLTLATSAGVEQMEANFTLQKQLGTRHELLTPNKLKQKFPWVNTENIVLGCHGLENEGWFDPWALLYGLKKGAIDNGVQYLHGEATEFRFKHMPEIMTIGVDPGTYQAIDQLKVKLPSGESQWIKFALCIIAAGAQSGQIAEMARIGTGEGLLSIPLPIQPRKRYVYCWECKNGPGLNTPLTIDPTGTYFRKEGLANIYIGGRSPTPEEEPPCHNLDVDHDYFNTHVWPIIANRVPCFESIKVRSAWAGFYEYNYFDMNGIVGPHPYYTNLYIAAGFSGHGIQHAPAIGRAVGEMILDGAFRTIDLTRFGFDRLVVRKEVIEAEIV